MMFECLQVGAKDVDDAASHANVDNNTIETIYIYI